jgi:excisionase family DNA binding protein
MRLPSSQRLATIEVGSEGGLHHVAHNAPSPQNSATRLLPDFRSSNFTKSEIDGPLLKVAEVAEALSVCRATVYALCERGELPHLRISNAIRVRRVDLEAFLAARITE